MGNVAGGSAPATAAQLRREEATYRRNLVEVTVLARKRPFQLRGRPQRVISEFLVPLRAEPARETSEDEQALARLGDAAPARIEFRDRPGLTRLPVEVVDSASIRYLDLRGCRLRHVPVCIARMQLHELNLGDNDMREFPAGVCHIVSLERLLLHRNRIRAVPPEVGRCARLFELRLEDNELEGHDALPASIGGLARLETLALSRNRLEQLPAAVGRLSRLRVLRADGNALRELPELGGLDSLVALSVARNALQALPPSLAALPALKTVDVAGNPWRSEPEVRALFGAHVAVR